MVVPFLINSRSKYPTYKHVLHENVFTKQQCNRNRRDIKMTKRRCESKEKFGPFECKNYFKNGTFVKISAILIGIVIIVFGVRISIVFLLLLIHRYIDMLV